MEPLTDSSIDHLLSNPTALLALLQMNALMALDV